MRTTFVACLALFIVGTTTALQILSPAHLSGFYEAPTYGKFFGPQNDFNVTGKAVLLEDDTCSLHGRNFTGYIVVYRHLSRTKYCSFEERYLSLAATGALGAVEGYKVLSAFDVPGIMHHMHGGSRGKTTKHGSMPWLQTSDHHFTPVVAALKQGEEVVVRLSPNENRWASEFASVRFILVLRVFVPALFFGTTILGVFTFRDLRRQGTDLVPQIAVGIEAVSMLALGLSLALSGVLGSDILPFPVLAFFGSGLTGWSYFTTFLVAMYWRSIQQTTRTFHKSVSVLQSHRVVISLVFLVFIGLDITVSSLLASYHNSSILLIPQFLLFFLANLITLCFFTYHSSKFLLAMHKSAQFKKQQHITSLSELARAQDHMLHHMSRWLLATSAFMLLHCVSQIRVVVAPWDPFNFLLTFTLFFVSRWGTGVTQIMAWRMPKPKRAHSEATQEEHRTSPIHTVDIPVYGKPPATFVE